MMVHPVLVYGLAAAATVRVEHRPPPGEPGPGLVACVTGMKPEAARRLARHPQHQAGAWQWQA